MLGCLVETVGCAGLGQVARPGGGRLCPGPLVSHPLTRALSSVPWNQAVPQSLAFSVQGEVGSFSARKPSRAVCMAG